MRVDREYQLQVKAKKTKGVLKQKRRSQRSSVSSMMSVSSEQSKASIEIDLTEEQAPVETETQEIEVCSVNLTPQSNKLGFQVQKMQSAPVTNKTQFELPAINEVQRSEEEETQSKHTETLQSVTASES